MKSMIFAKEREIDKKLSENPWKVLIVDDEEEVHQITKTVLSKFEYEDKKIQTISAYSGKEAIDVLKRDPDIALILLDVVMESDDAGLKTVRIIRDELKNKLVRIILRTGQPGSAPEQEVIRDYDINDYKEKTELTASKLYTSVISSLRSFKDMRTIEQNRAGLKAIIESSTTIFQLQSFKNFAQAVLEQLLSLMEVHGNILKKNAFSVVKDKDGYHLLAASGHFSDKKKEEILSEEVNIIFEKAIQEKKHVSLDGNHVYYFETKNGTTSLFYFVNDEELSNVDKSLIDIFSVNVSIAFENINLNKEIFETQKELIEKLGEVVENRSNGIGRHVKRVAEVSYLLAIESGLSEYEANLVKLASPMHDIGKVGIRDSILLKPSKLTTQEFEIMKTHAQLGADILGNSSRELLQTASIIAKEHHERYDGSGYPDGKKGKDIHIYGRITMLADVFDALVNKRCYKEAWEVEDALVFVKSESGKMFDPKLVELFLDNLESIKDICIRQKA